MYSVVLQYYMTLKSNRVPVCRNVVEEIDSAVQRVDPKRTMEVGSYRLDSMGNQKQKTVSNCPAVRTPLHFHIHTQIIFKTIHIPCELPCMDDCSIIYVFVPYLECIVYVFILVFLLYFHYMLTY
jgi:hypothetical protein